MKFAFDLRSTSFRDLQLRSDPSTSELIFEPEPLRKLAVYNRCAPLAFETVTGEGLRELLLAWYIHHLTTGGVCSAQESEAISVLMLPSDTVPLRLSLLWTQPKGLSQGECAHWVLKAQDVRDNLRYTRDLVHRVGRSRGLIGAANVMALKTAQLYRRVMQTTAIPEAPQRKLQQQPS